MYLPGILSTWLTDLPINTERGCQQIEILIFSQTYQFHIICVSPIIWIRKGVSYFLVAEDLMNAIAPF